MPFMRLLGVGEYMCRLFLVFFLLCGCSVQDQDEDGFGILQGDCDDRNPDVNPLMQEVCDGIDNDCDGEVDGRYARGGRIYYGDSDGDGFGSENVQIEACEAPLGFADKKWDCDEADANSNPDADEVCDGKDNDCDGVIDENTAIDAIQWYADYDGDGYGDVLSEYISCVAPSDFVSNSEDCNDQDPIINPDATENCTTEYDDNCNGDNNDLDSLGCNNFYSDVDGDGFAGSAACLCTASEEYYSTIQEDCNDSNPDFHPEIEENSPFVDHNCDGSLNNWQNAHHKITSHATGDNFGLIFDIADRNGDSHDDIIVYDGNGAHVFDGPIVGHDTNETAHLILPGDRGWWIPDINSDGIQDIVNFSYSYSNGSRGVVSIYSGDSTGTVQPEDAIITWQGDQDFELMGYRIPSVQDLTGDGIPDLLLNSYNSNYIRVYSLTEDISSSPDMIVYPSSPVTGVQTFARELGTDYDFNGDGISDLTVGHGKIQQERPEDYFHTPYGRQSFYESPLVEGAEPDWYFYGFSGEVAGTNPVGMDINNDGHTDMVYVDPIWGIGQYYAGTAAIKLGPLSYDYTREGWLGILDAEYWIVGNSDEYIDKAVIGPDLNANGQDELILSSPQTQRVYLIENPPQGHTYVEDNGVVIEDVEPDSGFAYYQFDSMLIDGVPSIIAGRAFTQENRGEMIFIFGETP